MSFTETTRLPIEAGALAAVPCHETRPGGRNWCATLAVDPEATGGFERQFWTRAKGSHYYLLPEDLPIGTALEFGADLLAANDPLPAHDPLPVSQYGSLSAGRAANRTRNRRYFFVDALTSNTLDLVECDTAKDAVHRGSLLLEQNGLTSRRLTCHADDFREAWRSLTYDERRFLLAEFLRDFAAGADAAAMLHTAQDDAVARAVLRDAALDAGIPLE